MADDHRYDWLDDDAVERLLRGGNAADDEAGADAGSDQGDHEDRQDAPGATGSADGRPAAAGAVDTAARTGADPDEAAAFAASAERVTAALRALADPAPLRGADPAGPLPGEEAALAAFRAARATTEATAAAAAVAVHPGPVTPEVAHTGRRRPAFAVRSLFRRPVKATLAMALAGCAVGGVAVAAGAGVLPGPFGGGSGEPAPANSVTMADGGAETAGTGSAGASAEPSHGGAHGTRPGETPGTGGTHRPGSPSATPGGRATDGPSATPRRDGKDEKGTDPTREPKLPVGGRDWAARICRDYLASGKRGLSGPGVNEEEARTLERAAGGSALVRAYCEQILGSADTGSGMSGGKKDDGSVWDDLRKGSLPGTPPLNRSQPSLGDPARQPGVTLSGTVTL
ncbi:hypothetical protein BLA24_26920 [Streptomyces cinnamoneus]|uniref:Extensin n=1 Tax=Streptomyces cinnamoneus TaxID=53446 RepID=A0A2G1XEK2_STRCJ|nr:hypothetical protein [Streptomyces cinnamoneus]PHQ49650.1 hypothetical protein BLA24_26920 [Streptomyces cinnamoneus]PPT14628.1 hypothetical protein CYQ11_18715 [Streptomyces cinnamoneus]